MRPDQEMKRLNRQTKVVKVLHAAPFPLMMAQDIATELNKDGSKTKAASVGGTLAGMRRQGIVSKRIICGGTLDLEQMRWMSHPRYRGRSLKNGFRPRKTYWFLTSRANEVYPHGADWEQKRDTRR